MQLVTWRILYYFNQFINQPIFSKYAYINYFTFSDSNLSDYLNLYNAGIIYDLYFLGEALAICSLRFSVHIMTASTLFKRRKSILSMTFPILAGP